MSQDLFFAGNENNTNKNGINITITIDNGTFVLERCAIAYTGRATKTPRHQATPFLCGTLCLGVFVAHRQADLFRTLIRKLI